MKAIAGRNSGERPIEQKGAAPSMIAGVHARSQPPAVAAAASGKKVAAMPHRVVQGRGVITAGRWAT
jgi:hypothetical protein